MLKGCFYFSFAFVENKGGINMEEYTIEILGKKDSEFTSKGNTVSHLICSKLPISTLQTNLSDFITRLAISLENVQSGISNYILDEIEINVEVSATGSISLVGAIEAGTTGGITLRFKRCRHE